MAMEPGTTRERRALALLAGTCLALAATAGALGWRLAHDAGSGVFFGEEALRDPEVRRRVISQLVENLNQPFDSHPDPDVGRILIADAERGADRSNEQGMRERSFEMPRPEGVVRVVLLGDSFVFGLNVETEKRLGAVLERLLTEGTEGQERFECLHLAVNSWNIHTECAYLRRQLDQLQPDLVIQVSVANDLDDNTGVRGFGAEATFAPRHRERADSLVLDRYAQSFLQRDTRNLLGRGLDHESLARFAEALEDLRTLRSAQSALPGSPRHLMVFHWGPQGPAVHEHLGRALEEDAPGSVLYVPLEFATDRSKWITPTDYHWNAEGHAIVGGVLYGLIRRHDLLPKVRLRERPDLEAQAIDWQTRGLEQVSTGAEQLKALLKDTVSAIDLPEFTLPEARQVYGGIDLEGLVSPYATFVLRRPDAARELEVRAIGLPDTTLAGLRPRVFLEGIEVGTLPLEPDQELVADFAIPDQLAGHEYLNVRFESADWVYRGRDLRHCVCFRLASAALR